MFNFFKKKIVIEEPVEESVEERIDPKDRVATITYHTDVDGYIWIDCYWSGDEAHSHLQFAELLEKISNGDLIGDTMEFVGTKCDTPEKKVAYMQIVETITNLQQMRLFKTMVGANQSGLTLDDEPVISPTNVVNTDK